MLVRARERIAAQLTVLMPDVFGGSDFLTKATKGLRGDVLDTQCGARQDVTQPFILTRIRQDASAGKCVAAVTSPPRQHTSCASQVLSASASVADLRHLARMSWIPEHCDSWFWDVPKIQTLVAQRRTAWPCRNFFLGGPCFWLGMWTAEIRSMLLAGVLGEEDVAV